MTPKILFVFGTRPESIKLAPLILEAQKRKLDSKVCFTGQHMEMALPILEFFKIKPDYNLNIMKPGQSLNDISLALFEKLTGVIKEYKPTHIIVQGDTSTAAVSSLIGFYEKIQIVHVEAGLRTYNMHSPWPEEFNRRLIALSADWHFAPTEKSQNILLNEGIAQEKVFTVGNTGIDALRIVCESNESASKKTKTPGSFHILVTLHRRESFGSEMISVMESLRAALDQNKNIFITWPIHQNPQVKIAFDQVFKEKPERLNLTAPLGYLEFVAEMQFADLIVTDSGGIQEEAPFLGKPTLVCRNNTERPESVECGTAKLVGTNGEKVLAEILELSRKGTEYMKMAQKKTPYGDGHASQKILRALFPN